MGGSCEPKRDDRTHVTTLSLGAIDHGTRIGARWFSAASCGDVPSSDSSAFVMQVGPDKGLPDLGAHTRDPRALDDVIVALGTEVVSAWIVFPLGFAELWESRLFTSGNDPMALGVSKTSRGLAIDWVLSPKAIAEGFEFLALRAK
jgi:hypothetical protein